MRPVVLLAEVNRLDLQADTRRIRLAEIAAALREPAALVEARSALDGAKQGALAAQAELRLAELAQKSAAEKLGSSQQRLYAGDIRVAKELENLQADVQQLQRQLQAAEDQLLTNMVGSEEAAALLAHSQEVVDTMSAEFVRSQASLRDEQVRLMGELKRIQARQAAAREAAPKDWLGLYDSLRPRRGGRAVVELEGDMCSACRVEASPQRVEAARYGEEPVYCENCGRLLWGE
jgi:uncharacterized protein